MKSQHVFTRIATLLVGKLYNENIQKATIFTRSVPHPWIVQHCGTIQRILFLFLEIILIVPHPRIVSHLTFCKHLLLVFPYPSQSKKQSWCTQIYPITEVINSGITILLTLWEGSQTANRHGTEMAKKRSQLNLQKYRIYITNTLTQTWNL